MTQLVFDSVQQWGARAWELLLEQLTTPFSSVTSALYWPHIGAALLLACVVHLSSPAAARGSLRTFCATHLSAATWWHRSARVDYAFYLVNGVIFPSLFSPHLLADAAVRGGVEQRLSDAFGARAEAVAPGAVAAVALTGAIFVAYDLGRWLGHWLMHRVPALWAFHKVHHSAEVLTPMTNFRAHPVELAVMAVSTTVTTGVCAGVVAYLLPAGPLWTTLSLGAALTLFVFDLSGSLLRHSSVWLSYGPLLERVLISPAQHQIHHSVDPRHMGKNLGFALAIWDAMAGTLYLAREREQLRVGLGDGSVASYRGVARAYLAPFAELFGSIGSMLIAGWSRVRSGATARQRSGQAARQPSRSTTA